MESNYNNRDFERFVKQNADQYRMFPSEKVWKGIHNSLHTRRRWYGIALALLFITTAVVTGVMLMPGSNNEKTITSISAVQASTPVIKENQPISKITAIVNPVKTPAIVSTEIDNPVQEETIFSSALFTTTNEQDLSTQNLVINNKDLPANEDVAVSPAPAVTENYIPQEKFQVKSKPAAEAAPVLQPVQNDLAITAPPAPADEKDNSVKKEDEKDLKLPKIPERISKNITRLGKKKLSWQVYVTPTISYRTLTENNAFIAAVRYNNYMNAVGGGSTGFYSTDVNTMVNHKPDIGFQVGTRAAYPLSKWLSLTGGFQLSVSKYDIKAYHHDAEVATIALTDRSVFSMSSFRNTNGYKENWLRNFYFSASIPVGLELKLSDGTKNYFGVAGTIQPTYVLDNRAYLISADYKNYAEMPSLIRRWNMNTSFEVFAAQTTGKVKWRVGPQVRYQAMSSFAKNYPIKEHLFDFGLKLGIQLK